MLCGFGDFYVNGVMRKERIIITESIAVSDNNNNNKR